MDIVEDIKLLILKLMSIIIVYGKMHFTPLKEHIIMPLETNIS
jgi:hypothetical protein